MTDLGARVSIREEQVGLARIAQSADIVLGTVMNSMKGPEDEPIVIAGPGRLERIFGPINKLSSGIRQGIDYFNNAGLDSGAFGVFVRKARPDAVLADAIFNTDQATINGGGRGKYYNRIKVIIEGEEDSFDFTNFKYTRFTIYVMEATDDTLSEYEEIDSITDLSIDDVEDPRFWLDVINDTSFDISIEEIAGNSGAAYPAIFAGVEYTDESIGTGDGIEKTFAHTFLNLPVQPESIEISVDGGAVAVDDGFGVVEGAGVTGTINYETGEMSVTFATAPLDTLTITVDYHKAPSKKTEVVLTGGLDGTQAITRTDITTTDLIAGKQGLYAFNKYIGRVHIFISDFETDVNISKDLINYCSNREINDRFAVTLAPRGYTAQKVKKHKRRDVQSNSSLGGMYWPHIKFSNTLKDGRSDIGSPLGMIIGSWYRKTNAENVNQPMAGTDMYLIGADGLEFDVEQGDCDIVYPIGVNPLISRPEGIIIWGNVTLAEADDYTQLNTRFMFMKLENELFDPAHAFAFKSVGPRLYNRTKLKIDGYMEGLFEDNYFEAESTSEAFEVICDTRVNTPATIGAKNFIIDIEVLENISGEYVKMRFRKKLR